MNHKPTQSLRNWSAESAYLKPTHSPGIGFMSQSVHPTTLSPLRKVLGRDFKTEKRPILSHSGRRPGIQKQNTHWIPVFTGMTTVVSVLFVQM